MKINNREQLKKIIDSDLTDSQKRNAIANLKNIKTNAMRMIKINKKLNLEIGENWNNQEIVTSWADVEKEGAGFVPNVEEGISYLLSVDNVEGYEVQYFEGGISEEEDNLANDRIYTEVMDLLGTNGQMSDEREILVPAESKLKVIEILDGRDDEGYITVRLESIK